MPDRTASAATNKPLEMPAVKVGGVETIKPPSAMQTINKLSPPKGMNTTTRLFAEPLSDDNARFRRVEDAVQSLRDDFDDVAPSIARLVAVEKDMKELVGQLQTLVVTPPQQARNNVMSARAAQNAVPTMGAAPGAMPQTTAAPQQMMKASGTATAKAVRFGEHVDKTRIVIDLSGKTSYTANVDNGSNILTVELPGVAHWSAQKRWQSEFAPLVSNYSVVPGDNGGYRLNAKLKSAAKIDSQMMIPPRDGKSERLVIDLYSSTVHTK